MECLDLLNVAEELGQASSIPQKEIRRALDQACPDDKPSMCVIPKFAIRDTCTFAYTCPTIVPDLNIVHRRGSIVPGVCPLKVITTIDDQDNLTFTGSSTVGNVASRYDPSDNSDSTSVSAEEASNSSQSITKPNCIRRRAKHSIQKPLSCVICGDKAKGYNFDVMTCESCKAFFRRSATKDRIPECDFDNRCVINSHSRKFCTSCRLAKCFRVGMRKDWILDEQTRKRRKQIGKRLRPKYQRTSAATQPMSENDHLEVARILKNHNQNNLVNPDKWHPTSQKCYPTPENDLYSSKTNSNNDTDALSMISSFIPPLIRFFRTFPEVENLSTADQSILLKGAIWETITLRFAILFDLKPLGVGRVCSSSTYAKTLGKRFVQTTFGDDLYEKHRELITTINSIASWDKPSLILLMVVNLFTSDSAELENKKLVSAALDKYVLLLKAYLYSKYPITQAKMIFAKLLQRLTEVREYAMCYSQSAANIDIDGSSMLRLLAVVAHNNDKTHP